MRTNATIKEMVKELKVHSTANHDHEAMESCDRLLTLLERHPTYMHKKIVRKWKGTIVPKSNVVYQVASKETQNWNNVSRCSKRRAVHEA